MRLLSALSFVALLAPALLAAQGVLVAPPGIFMDHRTRSGSIELYNPGMNSVEVSVSMLFGYPVSDSLGKVSLLTVADGDTAAASAARWIEAFPRRLILRPFERQLVRLLAKPPSDLADGEYWARIVVESKGSGMQAQPPADSSGIRVGLTLNVRTVLALLYRKGQVATGLAVSRTRARIVGDSLEVRSRFERRGNAAFIGKLHGALVDATGRQLGTFAAPLAVYYSLEPRITALVGALRPGRYVVRLRVNTDRDDVKREALLPIAEMRDSTAFDVPPRAR
jgi:hypothetical protein